jgi:hypothetical protein
MWFKESNSAPINIGPDQILLSPRKPRLTRPAMAPVMRTVSATSLTCLGTPERVRIRITSVLPKIQSLGQVSSAPTSGIAATRPRVRARLLSWKQCS